MLNQEQKEKECESCADYVPLETDEMEAGLAFCCEYRAFKSITDWCQTNYQPFSRLRVCKGDPDSNLSRDRPRFSFVCENVDNHSRKNPKSSKRAVQRTLFKGCTSVINVRMDSDKKWRIKMAFPCHIYLLSWTL